MVVLKKLKREWVDRGLETKVPADSPLSLIYNYDTSNEGGKSSLLNYIEYSLIIISFIVENFTYIKCYLKRNDGRIAYDL